MLSPDCFENGKGSGVKEMIKEFPKKKDNPFRETDGGINTCARPKGRISTNFLYKARFLLVEYPSYQLCILTGLGWSI